MRPRARRIAVLLLGLLASGYGVSLAAIALQTLQLFDHTLMRAQLLTNQAATTNGEWIDVSGFNQFSLDIRGITTATVEIDLSNEAIRPADTTHGTALNATPINADQLVMVNVVARWLKVRVPTYTSGTINCYFEGRAS